MEQWEIVRLRCERDREPIKRVARDLGLSPNTVRKYLRVTNAPTPPRYLRSSRHNPLPRHGRTG
jgi:transposase-like protein